jgi:hypothetical protein
MKLPFHTENAVPHFLLSTEMNIIPVIIISVKMCCASGGHAPKNSYINELIFLVVDL